ncbi:MAG: pyridoxamine 5'-phosphate oxidase [Sphingomonadaceae bacterium]
MDDPIARFSAWLAEADAIEPNDPNACALATADADGLPDVRMVLLKAFDATGFVFYTNLGSAKGRQLAANPRAALCFHWKRLRRQVRLQGSVKPVADTEADSYFATRPRESQLSAWASRQSEPLATRAAFEAALGEADRRFPGPVPRPPFWSGFRLAPEWIEFWEDRRGRQHHRERYVRDGAGWRMGLLFP